MSWEKSYSWLSFHPWHCNLLVTDRTVRVRVRVRSNHEVRSTEPKSNLIPTKIPIFWKSKSKQSEIDKKIFIFGEEKFYKKIASYNLTLIIAHAFIENRNSRHKRMFFFYWKVRFEFGSGSMVLVRVRVRFEKIQKFEFDRSL